MKVSELQGFFDSLYDTSFPEDGLLYGKPGMEVTGALFCWMANLRAVNRAIAEGCNLIVCHETGFYGLPHACSAQDYEKCYGWKANRVKKQLLDAHGIAVLRCHRTLDAVCVPHAFEERLGLGSPALIEQMAGYEAVRLFEIEPTRVGALVARWKEALGLSCIRAFAPDLDRSVQRMGLAWGGIGLHTNVPLVARLIELEAELLIGGETDEYTIELCADSGVDLIEFGHSVSETPGMVWAARMVSQRFPGVKVRTFEEPPLYRFL